VLRDALVADLRRLIGADAVLTDEAARIAAGTDFITRRGVPGAVARPATGEQVAALVGFAAERGVGVVTRGAATNLAAGIAPNGDSLVLDLAGMDRILEIDAQSRRAIVEPGVINADLKSAVAPAGLAYAPDPASTSISTIGGNIAENAGGPGCIKYGVTFHHVVALDVALADGRLVTFRDDAEVDLLGVMIGSEGTLGVVTRATLNLLVLPAAHWTAMAAFERVEDAALTVSEIIAAGVLPAALEICDRRTIELCEAYLPCGYPTDREAILFAELDGDPDEVARDAADLERVLRRWDPDLRTAANDEERAALWAGRLAAIHAYKATRKEVFVCDATVPRQRLPEMFKRARQIAANLGLDVATVGHAGDGNLHPTILYEPEELETVEAAASEIAAAALDLGGTLTGEHGIGTSKLGQMRRHFGPVELAAFRAIKRAFDPGGVLNPGVMLPSPEPDEPDLPAFGKAVSAALAGRTPVVTPPAPVGAHDQAISVDAENMTLTVGGGASCRDASAAAATAGLSCPAVEADGVVADIVEAAGNRQPARAVLLGIEALLPGGHHARFGSAAMKDVAGLDAKRLVAGGRGAFGRVERAILRAMPGRH
jgi:glycolate dehydrogenase FAD-linked subunit